MGIKRGYSSWLLHIKNCSKVPYNKQTSRGKRLLSTLRWHAAGLISNKSVHCPLTMEKWYLYLKVSPIGKLKKDQKKE
jgi:hypothetical protein